MEEEVNFLMPLSLLCTCHYHKLGTYQEKFYLGASLDGKPTQKVKKEYHILYHCDTLDENEHNHEH